MHSQGSEHEERRAFVGEMLRKLYGAFNQPAPAPEEWRPKLAAWCDALEDVPGEDVPALTQHLIRSGGQFMPSAGEAFIAWRKMNGVTPNGAANVSAYKAFDPGPRSLPEGEGPGRKVSIQFRQRLESGKGGVCCGKCGLSAQLTANSEYWVCTSRTPCLWSWPANDTLNAPGGAPGPLAADLGAEPPQPRKPTKGEVLLALSGPCDLELETLPEGAALDFARHLFTVCGIERWTAQLARDEWPVWYEKFNGCRFWQSGVAASA